MRKLIDLISLAQTETLNEGIAGYAQADAEPPRRDGGPTSPNGFLRINSVMNQIAGSSLNSEDGATVLLQRLNYLCDAISEFGERRGGAIQRKMDDAVTHLRSFFPRDGDIEGALRNPQTMQEIRDGLNFLRTQLRADGIMVEDVEPQVFSRCEQCGEAFVEPSQNPKCSNCASHNEEKEQLGEGEDFYEKRKELKAGDVFKDRDGDLVKLDQRVEGDGTKWEVAVWWGSSWSYDGTTIEPGDLVSRAEDPTA